MYSSEFQPASEHGLLAISALGLITSDLTLAAAALTELVKIGEKGFMTVNYRHSITKIVQFLWKSDRNHDHHCVVIGDENLIAEACYLFGSFYAFQV